MKADLRRFHSPDALDVRAFVPNNPKNFSLFIQAMVGPAGALGEESFDLIVCTPAWLLETVERSGPLIGRHHIIVARFDYDELEGLIRSFCDRCDGATWQEVAAKVARLGGWEFEDYREYPTP